MMSVDLTSIQILYIQDADYHCIFIGITKSEVLNLLRKANLSEKGGSL